MFDKFLSFSTFFDGLLHDFYCLLLVSQSAIDLQILPYLS